MADPVNWDLAEKVATRVAGREPFSESYHYASLQPDFDELTAEAEGLVAEATGLRPPTPARGRVTDRAGWVHANIKSFQRLLGPVTERLGSMMTSTPLAPVGRAVAGAELGTMLGWMSTRVLGQYDLLLIEDESPEEQDVVYYVGPNVLALEKRFSFPPREFRLWLALHEVTHRAQFTGVPWMTGYFRSLVEATIQSVDPSPGALLEALRRTFDEVRAGRNPLDEGGIVALLATPEQAANLQKVQGLMSLLEGHGDVTMDRAGAARIPSAERFGAVLRQRRQQGSPITKFVQKLIGLEAKMNQYEQGEKFIAAVESAGGKPLFDRVWEGPEMLPTSAEIRDPDQWIARVQAGSAVA